MNKTYIIAEIGVNHNGSLKLAYELIKKAKLAGANAVKFQMYKTEDNYDLNSTNKKIINWSKKLSLKKIEYFKLSNFCKKINIEFISSVFDEESLTDYLSLKPRIIKIPSSEIYNFKLLDKIKKTKLISIFSNGIADINEIRNIKKNISKTNYYRHRILKENLYCLYCVSKYPVNPKEINLDYLRIISEKTKISTGFSDHTNNIIAPVIASYLGAKIIEKHFKLDHKHKCPDENVSLSFEEFKEMVNGIHQAEKLAIKNKLNINNIDFIKKGFYANQSIKSGTKIKKKLLTLKKPNQSNNLKLTDILGKKYQKDLIAGQPIKKKYLK